MAAKLYIAGNFEDKARLAQHRDWLEKTGKVKVVSTWLNEPDLAVEGKVARDVLTPAEIKRLAERDVAEIEDADFFVLDTTGTNVRGGREVEFGFALASGIPTTIVGPRRNVFHELAMHHYDNWEQVYAALSAEG